MCFISFELYEYREHDTLGSAEIGELESDDINSPSPLSYVTLSPMCVFMFSLCLYANVPTGITIITYLGCHIFGCSTYTHLRALLTNGLPLSITSGL